MHKEVGFLTQLEMTKGFYARFPFLPSRDMQAALYDKHQQSVQSFQM
jgi:hypothetical protein